jgi:hypothetical protein
MMSAQLQSVHIGQRQQWPGNGMGMGGVGRSEGLAQMKNFTSLPPGLNFTPTCGNVEQRVQQNPANPHCTFKTTILGRLSSGPMTSPQKPSYQQFHHPQQGIVQHPQITQVPLPGHLTNDFPPTYRPRTAMEVLQQQQQQHQAQQRIAFANNVSILTPPSSNPQSNGSIESGGLHQQLSHDFKDKNTMHMSTAEYELENWGAVGDLTTVQTTDEFTSFFGIDRNGVGNPRRRVIANYMAIWLLILV